MSKSKQLHMKHSDTKHNKILELLFNKLNKKVKRPLDKINIQSHKRFKK